MGINPMMSMLSWLSDQKSLPFEVEVLYSAKLQDGGMKAERLLFVERIVRIFKGRLPGRLKLFVTNNGLSYGKGEVSCDRLELRPKVPCELRRMTCDTCVDRAPVNDLAEAVGKDKDVAVVYVCGPPAMTDEFVAYLTSRDGLGMDPERVLFEKWW
jgi:ferredoxin-NADP reductase